MTRRMAPVLGSRSTSISSGSMCWGALLTMFSAWAVLVEEVSAREDFASLRPSRAIVFSVPPVAWLRREVRPRRR